MKTEIIFKERLLLFSKSLNEHIGKTNFDIREALLEWPLRNSKLYVFYHVKFNVNHFNCLLNLFEADWYFNKEFQEPQLRYHEGGLPRGFIDFFGLEGPEEYIHLFDCQGKYQDTERWGGLYLYEHSPSTDIALNVFEFISKN